MSTPESDFGPLDSTRVISTVDFARLEKKMDRMADAIGKLVLVEERQSNQKVEIAELHKDVEANRVAIERTDRLLQQWIQRGIGAWVVLTLIATLIGFALSRTH